MDKQLRIYKVEMMGLVMTAILVIAFIAITWYRVDQHIAERHERELRQAQSALIDKQTEVQGLQRQVAAERTVINASRGIGLMQLHPGPWHKFTATWYSPEGGQGDGRTTFTGTRVHNDWTVAVDPRVIPLGSIVQVKFQDGTTKIYQALDTGGAIKGHRIDIYDSSLKQCFENGMQHVEVRILLKGGK